MRNVGLLKFIYDKYLQLLKSEVKFMKLASHNTILNEQNQKIISEITLKVKEILDSSSIIIPSYFPLEISHHYGLSQFAQYGCVIISIINREYCKKIIILFPGQRNPTHLHKIKEETFQVLKGNMELTVDGKVHNLSEGELFTVERKMAHSFYSANGCIFEEISTTHNGNDSYYEDIQVASQNPASRKTLVIEWQS